MTNPIAITEACIIRTIAEDGAVALQFIGAPDDPRGEALARIVAAGLERPNAADLLLVDGLPVIDEWTAEQPVVVILNS